MEEDSCLKHVSLQVRSCMTPALLNGIRTYVCSHYKEHKGWLRCLYKVDG